MRKNLFLTLALAFASFAGAAAQDWAVTLGPQEGLPGVYVTLDGGTVRYFKSGIIRTAEPITSLRLTCAGNSTNNKPNGNNFRMMLSELNVYTADMSRELTYTVTTNADHNTLANAFDGQGLRALYDGKYNNYFSTMSAEAGAVTDYHYVELTFEEKIDRFIIEWAGKAGSGEVPSCVGLTEGGVEFTEPYGDRSTSFGEEKIADLDELIAADYFTIKGNAVKTFTVYYGNNNEGKYGQVNTEETEKIGGNGSGPMYVVLGDAYAKAPTLDYLTKFVPAGDDTYYMYFPMQNKYLNGDATDNALNDAQNGWQYATSDIKKAAKITLNPLDNGDFEMSYVTKFNGSNITVYIGADPRTGKMKIFSTLKKVALEANKYCEGFGIECAFNWSFYPAEYSAPVWAKEYNLGVMELEAEKLLSAIENHPYLEENGYVEALQGYIAEIEETIENVDEMDGAEINAAADEAKANLSQFIIDIASEEVSYMAEQEDEDDMEAWGFWKENSTNDVKFGWWSLTAFNTYIQPGWDLLSEIEEADLENCYDEYIAQITNYFATRQENIDAFLASEYKTIPLPATFATEETALGTKDGDAFIWEQNLPMEKAVNGIRLTFLETNVGNAAGGGKWGGYPMVALGDLQIYDNEGNQISFTATTNSQETSEGAIENLNDGKNDTFWHSIWGNGTMNPKDYVYLDLKFADGTNISTLKIKSIGRNNASLSPKKVVVSEYGKKYDEGATVVVENPYNVKLGAQVTDVANLKDGGLYILAGNLEGAVRFYEGTTPSTNTKESLNEKNVYMFKKTADGWNILSLSKAMFWVEEPEYGTSNLILYQSVAGDVKFTSSKNIANAFAMYRDITPEELKGSFSNEEAGVNIPETAITVSKLVYMDWADGLASRPCYSELPGVVAPGCEALTADLKSKGAAGDYLHFNKTNGEGEWAIYEATMDDAHYLYLTGLVNEIDNLNLITGNNPGCIIADEATAAAFNNAKAAAEVAVDTENKGVANTLATNLLAAAEKMKDSERVGFESEVAYRIESGLPSYEDKTWYTRSIYVDYKENNLKWTVTPEEFETANREFLFSLVEVTKAVTTANRWTGFPEDLIGESFLIKAYDKSDYVGAHADNRYPIASTKAPYLIKHLDGCNYEISCIMTGDEFKHNNFIHTEGHGEGNGHHGVLVSWNCNPNKYTASSWTFINMGEMEKTSVEDLVIEGDEVVSVSYFTPAGVAIPAPVQGINIVVTVYANGVVEAKKKFVK